MAVGVAETGEVGVAAVESEEKDPEREVGGENAEEEKEKAGDGNGPRESASESSRSKE